MSDLFKMLSDKLKQATNEYDLDCFVSLGLRFYGAICRTSKISTCKRHFFKFSITICDSGSIFRVKQEFGIKSFVYITL